MKRVTIILSVLCVILSGCGVGLPVSDGDVEMQSTVDIFDIHTTYFDNYTCEIENETCKVRGTIHQAADDCNGVLTYVTAQDELDSMIVTGSMDCTRGSIQLVYTAPDGTETLIADDVGRKIDAQIEVAEGEGTINFVSNGKSAVCEFNIKIKTENAVTFSSSQKEKNIDDMSSEMKDESFINKSEITEEIQNIEQDLEELDKEINNNWPESICYSATGVYADPMITEREIGQPTMLSLSCETRDGRLQLKIIDKNRKTVYFDEVNPDGIYTVDIDWEGTYQVFLYAKYHTGSIMITPIEE